MGFFSISLLLLFITTDLFLSVSTQPIDTFPVLESFFPKESLNPAFEKYPILSKVSSSEECTEEEISTVSITNDDTILVNGTNYRLQDLRMYQATQLIKMEDLDRLLQQPELKYQVVKKTWRDGREWVAVLQPEQIDELVKVAAALQLQFSLVVSRMHQQWPSISSIARKLELESEFPRVSSNLYLTPPNSTAFDSHWDFMDVIIVQVVGKKYWNVAKRPTVYLSTEELKYKPSVEEANEPYYPTFVMEPGDALYIPRGFLHNASTEGLDPNEGPSLHLTFGLEPLVSMVEDLVKFAFDTNNNDINRIIHEKASENKNKYNVFRRTVPLYESSWRNKNNNNNRQRVLFEEAVEEIQKVADRTNNYVLAKATKAASKKFDTAFQKFVDNFDEFRKMQHNHDNNRLKRAGYPLMIWFDVRPPKYKIVFE